MPHHSEDTTAEILRCMPRYKLSDEKVNEQIEWISRRINCKRFSVLRGLQIAAFSIAAVGFIISIPLMFNWTYHDTNHSSQDTVQGVDDKEDSQEESITKEEKQLQAIEKAFEDAQSPPQQGIKDVQKPGDITMTEYENGIVIDEDGTMSERVEGAEPEPYQYKAFIKGLISDIGPRANGYSSAEDHIKSIREGNGFIGVGGPNTYDHQMKRMNQCLKYAPEISPELNQYLSDTKEVLEEAVHNKDKEKLAEAFKRIYDLHAVLFPEN